MNGMECGLLEEYDRSERVVGVLVLVVGLGVRVGVAGGGDDGGRGGSGGLGGFG